MRASGVKPAAHGETIMSDRLLTDTPTSEPTPEATPTATPLRQAFTIDDRRVQSHLDQVVRATVEETLNALLDVEAD